MAEEHLKLMVDWELPPQEFEEQIGQIIHQYRVAGKMLPLPIPVSSSGDANKLLIVLLSKVDCTGCDAACCRRQTGPNEMFMDPKEYADLQVKYPAVMRDVCLSPGKVILPCPLLKDGHCQVYPDRPFVCWLYPVQFGSWIGTEESGPTDQALALCSSCPGARKLAKFIYLNHYQMRRQLQRLGFISHEEKR